MFYIDMTYGHDLILPMTWQSSLIDLVFFFNFNKHITPHVS